MSVEETVAPSRTPPFLAADSRLWLRIGCLSFGGPAGQIALLQRLLVDERRWITPDRFAAGLDLCMLLPGPEAQQLATYIGWTRQGWRGGVVAGGLFVLPGAALMLFLAAAYSTWGSVAGVAALFSGLQCAVVAIVAQALVQLAGRALGSLGAMAIAAAAFVALAAFAVPYPLVVGGAALAGLLLGDRSAASPSPVASASGRSSRTAAAVAALLWALPLALLVLLAGREALLVRLLFAVAELALVSFGGAYALLAALAERAVGEGWLTATAMADGLALAETTPGPLILVLPFVVFVAAHAAGGLAPAFAAFLLAIWVLFLPSFVWIFLTAPHLERVERSQRLRRALRGVTAAVAGVIFHLSLFLALHVLFDRLVILRRGRLSLTLPDLATLDPFALAVTAVSAVMLFALRQSLARTLAVAAILGLVRLTF